MTENWTLKRLIQYSATGRQLLCRFEQFHWLVINRRNGSSLKVLNTLSSITIDMLLAFIFSYWIFDIASITELLGIFTSRTQDAVSSLKFVIHWLMGSPAGLKLNHPLNSALGEFFLYHIYLWETYIELMKPYLLSIVITLWWMGKFGLSIYLSLFADLFEFAACHVFCFYVYAARLYQLQIRALAATWRLFRGCKWNPLRQRVDSCDYSVKQLFVGTLAFTILFFLLPTTMTYYVVFTVLRLIVITVLYTVHQLCLLLNTMYVYSFLLWLIRSKKVQGSVRMKIVPAPQSEEDQSQRRKSTGCRRSVLTVELSCLPLRDIVEKSRPEKFLPETFCLFNGSFIDLILGRL